MKPTHDPIAEYADFPCPIDELRAVKLQIAQHALYEPTDSSYTYKVSVLELTPTLGRAIWELCNSDRASYGIAENTVYVNGGRILAEWYTDQNEGTSDPNGSDNWLDHCRHSEDFASIDWFGECFVFTTTQRAVMTQLWQAKLSATPAISDTTLLERAGSGGSQLRDIFRSNGKTNKAWGRLIVKATRNSTKLANGKICEKFPKTGSSLP